METARGTRRLPALDNYLVVRWVNSDLVVRGGFISHTQEQLVDLRTGTLISLPGLPKRVFYQDLQPGGSPQFGISYPCPSPDGRWVLYEDTDYGKPNQGATAHRSRWRLMSRTDSREHLVPHGGSYNRLPAVDFDWLADSSGWVALQEQFAGEWPLLLYPLATPELPVVLRRYQKERPYWLRSVTQEGFIAFQSQDGHQVELVPVSKNLAQRTVHISPSGHSSDTRWGPMPLYRTFDEDTPPGRPVIKALEIPRSGRFIVALVQERKSGPASPSRGAQGRSEFWRIPTDQGKPRQLFALNQLVEEVAVAPNGKSLVYWLSTGTGLDDNILAYRVALD